MARNLSGQIIPNGLMADRDLLTALGYSVDDDKALLKSSRLAPRIAEILEQAYANFVKELARWREIWASTPTTYATSLVRIYREQDGGGTVVAQDRRERRIRLKETLIRLGDDKGTAMGPGNRSPLPTLRKLPER